MRRVLATLGLEVNRLIRISFGPFQLLDLKPRTTEPVRRSVMADQLGPQLSEQFKLTGEEEPLPSTGRKRRGPRASIQGQKKPRKTRQGFKS